jgi:hypothetical protein
MQENSFEKKVQQKMEELSFEPSEPVWQKVELQIQQKRRRRRLVFLLLPLLLVGSGLALYFAGTNQSATPVAQTEIKDKGDATTNITPTDIPVKTIAEKNNTSPETKKALTNNNNQSQKEKQRFFTISKKSQKQLQKNSEKIVVEEAEEPAVFMGRDLHALVLQNEIDKIEGRKKETDNISNPFQKKQLKDRMAENETAAKLNELRMAESAIADSTSKAIAAKEKTEMDSAVVDVAYKPKGKTKVLEWGLHARVGVAGLRSNVASVFGQESLADFSSAPTTGNNSPPAGRIAAKAANHLAFTIGGSLRKKTFQNAFVSVGLQYSYYSTQSSVGTHINNDTTVAYNGRSFSLENYYTSTGAAEQYTNRFHYLELPLAVDYRPFKKLPLQLQHGLSIGRLIATNALYYNSAAGFYYRNDNWLRKTSFNLFTSVDYRLLQAKSFSLFAGPQLQWALSPVQQKEENKKQHFFFGGLNAQLRF